MIFVPCQDPDGQQKQSDVRLVTAQGRKLLVKYLAVIGVHVIFVIWGSSVSVRLNSRENKYRDDLMW